MTAVASDQQQLLGLTRDVKPHRDGGESLRGADDENLEDRAVIFFGTSPLFGTALS